MSNLHNMKHDVDPKKLLADLVGDISGVTLSGRQVLVATYIRPEKMKSGLIITESLRAEDKFQGKCGLVIKMGPLAWVEDADHVFGGFKAEVGEWVWYRPVDGYSLSVNNVHCRVIDDEDLKGKLETPDIIL